jgi:hypothetical protein
MAALGRYRHGGFGRTRRTGDSNNRAFVDAAARYEHRLRSSLKQCMEFDKKMLWPSWSLEGSYCRHRKRLSLAHLVDAKRHRE